MAETEDRRFDANMIRLLEVWKSRQRDSQIAHTESLEPIKTAMDTIVYDSEDEVDEAMKG